MQRKCSQYNQSQTTRSRLRSVSPSQFQPLEFMITTKNSFQTKSQQSTPLKVQCKPEQLKTDYYGLQNTEQEIRKLRIKSVRTQSQFDNNYFIHQIQEQIQKKQASNTNQEFDRIRNLSIYRKLKEMKLKEEFEKKQILEKELKEKRMLQQKHQLKIDENLIQKKKKTIAKFKISTIVNALTLQQIHAKSYQSKFAKLVAKHYLTILDYNNYIEAKREKENHPSQNNTPRTVNLDNQQILEIQDLINGGIIRVQCEKKQQKHRIEVKAADIFSDNVLKRVRLLQSCFHLKVFSKKNKTHKYRRQQTTVITSSRVKAQSRRLGDIKFMNQYSPKQNKQFWQTSGNQELQQQPKKSLRLFRSLTKGSIQKQKSSFFQRQNTNDFFLRGVQMLHYPIIKYISIFYKNMVVWSISYKDITADKSCLILFFKGEGRYKYRYRLDIPIGQSQSVNYSENCLTVWPTVRDYLISYLQMKGQLALIDQKQLPTAQIYKLNFIKGLTDRSRMKITSLDIYGITETIKILDYLQKAQIVKIRKIFGTVFELLPQFVDINKFGAKQQLIINLPFIHNLILQLRTYEQKLLLQKRSMGEIDDTLIDRYYQFLQCNSDFINQIIMFRFLHNNPQFYRDQLLKDAQKLDQKQIYIQSATIKLNNILQVESNQDHLSFGSYCLLSLFIQITCKTEIKLLLLDVNNKQTQNLSDVINLFEVISKQKNQINLLFKQEYFQFIIKISFHERDEAGYNQQQYQKNLFSEKQDRQFKQLELNVSEWIKLCSAIKKSKLANDEEQSFDFNKLIKSILLEQQFYSKIAEYTLKTVFSFSLKTGQIVLKQSFKHILSVQFNLLEQLDYYHFQKCMGYVYKFSVYPTEIQDIKVIKPEQKRQSIIQKSLKQFNKSFKQINTTDIKLNKANTKISLIVNYQYEYRVSQSIQSELQQFQMQSYFCAFGNQYKYQIVNNEIGLKIILMKLFKSNIIIKIDDEELIYKILTCEKLNQYKINQQINGLIHKIFQRNNFIKNNLNFFIQKKKHPLPSVNQIKFMLINDSNQLLNIFDRLIYTFLFKYPLTESKIFIHAKIYFICKDIHLKNNEKLFYFQQENFYLGLEIFELKSKLKKYIIIMNKYDIEKLFTLKEYLNTEIIHFWCQTIINNISFDKQNIYRLPYLTNLNQFIIPKLNDDDQKKQKFKRSMTNDYKSDEKANDGKQFLRPQIKLFRVVGHYVIKYFVIQQTNQIKLLTRLTDMKYDDPYKSISVEFVIITIQAHNIFDMFRITYYFPKSKRRLMTYLSILQFQEMDFRDNLIFDLLDFEQFKSYRDIEQYLKNSKSGPHFKHSMQLDKQVLTKIKFMKQSVDIQHPFQQAFKKSQNNFLKVSDDLITKNRFLLSQIKQNQQLSEKVIKFLQFTRQLNNDQQFEQQHKFLEIKIWELLLQQVFELKYSNTKFINNYIHLIDRIIQTFDSTRRNQIKIVGKEYLLKQVSSNSLKNNYTVQSNVTQLYTRLILTHNIKVTEKLNFPQTDIILNIGVLQYPLLEFICSQEIKLERLGNAYLECFLEHNKVKSQNQSIFYPQPLIQYSQSSDYNIYLRYYCIQNLRYKDIRLNMRELLNLFIADGFFKSKTNYMNSRLSQGDIQNMCFYLSQKIRDQNYLNLSSLVLLKKEKRFSLSSQIILETQDALIQNQNSQQQIQGEGEIFTHIKKNKQQIQILQFQMFISSKRIIVNITDNKTLIFDQKIYTFVEANELTPNFLIFIKLKQFRYALSRLATVITSNSFQNKNFTSKFN